MRERTLLDLELVGQCWKVALDETTDATEATTKEGQRVLLQKTKQSRNDGDRQSTDRVGSGKLCQYLAIVVSVEW